MRKGSAPRAVVAALAAGALAALAEGDRPPEPPGPSRTVAVQYTLRLGALPPGARKIEAWIPYPQDGPGQRVRDVRIALPGSFRAEVVHDGRYGNAALRVSSEGPPPAALRGGPAAVTLEATVTRHELRGRRLAGSDAPLDRSAFAAELRPDNLGPLLPQVVRLAKEAVAGRETLLERARGLYDKVLSIMRYDKSKAGWGRGDLVWVCNARQGNCTDFHSLFAAMARSEGIPVRFELGLGLPPRGQGGSLAGYHCWAYFFLPGEGWVPVDISEAWKQPERRDYFFGSLDQNRLALSVGRDIVFPGMNGPPLNLFFSPYVEVDGVPLEEPAFTTTFQDLDPA